MPVFSYNLGIVLLGVSLLGVGAGMIGTFAVLRRRALMGDALAHATLPGPCLAFMIVGERQLLPLLIGAALTGLAGIFVLDVLRRFTRLKEDAGLGIVLGVFYGFGTVLLSIIQSRPGGNKAGLDSFLFGKTAGMTREDVFLIGGLSLGTVFLVLLLFKELKLTAFDTDFAHGQGWPIKRLDFLLLLLIVIALVIGLPAVGVLMMAALLVIPPATARLWTNRLGILLLLSAGLGALSGILGTLLSASVEKLPTGPCIILFASGFFLVSLLFAPGRGLLAQWGERREVRKAFRENRFLGPVSQDFPSSKK